MLKPGDQIDVWVVDRPLGQGGMGSVYRCHNREARRILAAVKVLDPALNRQTAAKARFVREAEILFGLDHPGIVKVRNVRMDLTMPYLEMEFIDGVNLEARIRLGPVPASEALPLFRQVADALAYLHAQGVRHRDIKPSNIVVQQNGAPRIVDFGIAMEADGSTITLQGQTLGSVSYAPPEWLDPSTLDAVRWDVYAAGLVFWEVLAGAQAFPVAAEGSFQQQAMRIIAWKQRTPPMDPGPGQPRALRALIRDMTHPDPASRLSDAGEVVARLAAVDLGDLDDAPVMDASAWARSVATPAVPSAGATMVPSSGPRAGGTMVPGGTVGPPPPDSGATRARAEATMVPGSTDAGVGAAGLAAGLASPPIPTGPTRLLWLGGGLAGLVAAGTVAALVAPGLSLPDTRDVSVTVSGLPAGTPFAVTLGGAPPASREGDTLRFPTVGVGDVSLRAAVGPGCAAAERDPEWCAPTTATLQVPRAREPLAHTLTLSLPAPRAVELAFAGLAADAVPRSRLDGGPVVAGTHVSLTHADVSVGVHRVSVALGTCTDADEGCSSAAAGCPPGCSSWVGEITLPVGEGALRVDVPLVPPVTPAPVAGPRARSRGGGVVTHAAFARWLASHPEWSSDAARADGRADAGYLSGWDGLSPPAGKASLPVVNVSWAAAAAYCAGRGGLPGLDDAPLSWAESPSTPWIEYRDADGRPAWRRSDGAPSVALRRSESGPATGFRCGG